MVVIRDSLLKRMTKTLHGQQPLAACQCSRANANASMAVVCCAITVAALSTWAIVMPPLRPVRFLAPAPWLLRLATRKQRKVTDAPNAPFIYPPVFRAVVTSQRLVFLDGPASQARKGAVLAEYMLARDLVSVSASADHRLCIALRSGHELRVKTKRKDLPAMVALLEPYCHAIVPSAPPAFDAQPVPLGFGDAHIAATPEQPESTHRPWSAAPSPLPPPSWLPPQPPARVSVPGT
jgi:hypothetical protein